MPNQQEQGPSASAGQARIWLVRSPGQPDRQIVAFWERAEAVAFADAWSAANAGPPPVLSEVVVRGDRRRCRLCGESIVLDDPSDAESWRHADDANDLGDHTAEA
jgi:hypothetical protein